LILFRSNPPRGHSEVYSPAAFSVFTFFSACLLRCFSMFICPLTAAAFALPWSGVSSSREICFSHFPDGDSSLFRLVVFAPYPLTTQVGFPSDLEFVCHLIPLPFSAAMPPLVRRFGPAIFRGSTRVRPSLRLY